MSVALLAFRQTMKELKAYKDGDTLHVVQMRPKIYTSPTLTARILTTVKNVLSCSCLRKKTTVAEEISVKESIIRLIDAHHHEAQIADLDGISVCENYLRAQSGDDVTSCLQRISKIRERLYPPTELSNSLSGMRMSGHIDGIKVTADLIENLMKEDKFQEAAIELNRTKQEHEIRDLGKLLGVFFAKAQQDKEVLNRLDKLMQIVGADLHSITLLSYHLESDSISNEVLQRGFAILLSRCKNLERLFTDDKLICSAKPNFSSCSKLESFTITFTGRQAILAFGALEIPTLRTLKINIHRSAEVRIIPPFEILDNLTTLVICDMRSEKDLRIPHLSQIPTLRTIELNGILLGEEDKAALANTPPLTSMTIHTISDQSMIAKICEIKTLTKLSLSLTGITYKTFHDLAQPLPELTTLEVRALTGESGPDLIAEYLKKFSKLQHLTLPNFILKSVDDVKAFLVALKGSDELIRVSVGVASRAVDAELKAKCKEAYPDLTIETGLKS